MKCGKALLCILVLSAGCSSKKSSNVATSDRISPTYDGPAETTFCSSATTYAGGVTITGHARYTRRNIWGNVVNGGLGSASTSGTHPATDHPIRQAEVRITDSAGGVVQCAATDDSGAFTFTLPTGSTTYTVSVNSRAYNNLLRVSVLNQPEKNQFYSLRTTVSANSSTDVGTLMAAADGEILGGAFNILDQIYNAASYVRNNADCTGFTGCRDASTVLPKVVAYWTKGFNPNAYFGSSTGLSFYLPGYSRLFILGGVNGDVDSSDTDHFDDSVVIHEYGHFLEDSVGNSDSPGGQHTGNKIIDARLAWSEGWGNFIQAAVRGDAHYIDSIGNDDGQTDLAFYVGLETVTAGGYDYTTTPGEGNFREFSVTRTLWDAIDANADGTDATTGAFDEIWAAFTSTTHGLGYAGYAFRNVGLVHLAQQHFAKRDWSGLRTQNYQAGDMGEFGQYLSTTCGAAPYAGGYYYQITPANNSGDDGSFSRSDLFANNDFFHFRAPAGGSHQLKLVYKDADGNPQEADLDFYVYKDDFRFGSSSDWVGYSRLDPTGAGNTENEPVTAALTANANYMLNVFVYTGGGAGSQAYYNILYDGSPLCPGSLVPP